MHTLLTTVLLVLAGALWGTAACMVALKLLDRHTARAEGQFDWKG